MGKYYSIFAGVRSSSMHKFVITIKIMQKIWREWVRDLSIFTVYYLSVHLSYQSINPDIKIHKDIIYQSPSSCAPLACCTHSCKEGRWDDQVEICIFKYCKEQKQKHDGPVQNISKINTNYKELNSNYWWKSVNNFYSKYIRHIYSQNKTSAKVSEIDFIKQTLFWFKEVF